MAIVWPHSLLAEIAERRCAFVLGAGASASSISPGGVSPPDWETLLQRGIATIPSDEDREAALELLASGSALDAAQILADALGPADFGMFIREELEEPGFQPSQLHEHIVAIDPKVVITTNYDRIFETLATSGAAAAGYNVCRYYDSHFVNDLRSTRRLIVKAHGCVSNPQRVVFTRQQYFNARRDCPQFFAALDALFLTSTLLFIGSGFAGDPDIELLLQNANISAPSEHTHFALVEGGRHASVRQAIERTHNVTFLEYDAGDHGQVVEALRQLAEDVQAYRAVDGP